MTSILDDSSEVERIAKAFNRQFHAFHNRFRIILDQFLLIHLFKSYCPSFYGLESVAPDEATASSKRFLRKSVNLALMRMLNLPRESISPFLIAYGVYNADASWKVRYLTFWGDLMNSPHPLSDFLVASNSEAIIKESNSVGLLPASLYALSRQAVKSAVVSEWSERKIV